MIYDTVRRETWGIKVVVLKDKFGAIDKDNNEILHPMFDDIEVYKDNAILVRQKDKWGYYDFNGNNIVEVKYDDIGSFRQDLLMVKKNNKWGFVDREENKITKLRFDYVTSFREEGYAIVEIGDKWGIINTRGEEIVPVKYKDIIEQKDLNRFKCIKFNDEERYINIK